MGLRRSSPRGRCGRWPLGAQCGDSRWFLAHLEWQEASAAGVPPRRLRGQRSRGCAGLPCPRGPPRAMRGLDSRCLRRWRRPCSRRRGRRPFREAGVLRRWMSADTLCSLLRWARSSLVGPLRRRDYTRSLPACGHRMGVRLHMLCFARRGKYARVSMEGCSDCVFVFFRLHWWVTRVGDRLCGWVGRWGMVAGGSVGGLLNVLAG